VLHCLAWVFHCLAWVLLILMCNAKWSHGRERDGRQRRAGKRQAADRRLTADRWTQKRADTGDAIPVLMLSILL
jgi:hypothetical protein